MELSWPRVAMVGLAVALLVTLGVAGATSTAAFGVYNPAWDGASQVRDVADGLGVEQDLVTDVAAYDRVAPNGSLAVVLAPETPYDNASARQIESFVRAGGHLLLAADVRAAGPDLLSAIGANASVVGAPLRDERNYGASPAFPVAANVTAHPYTGGVAELVLNHPSAVTANGTLALVWSSPYAYLDENGNEALDDAETLQQRPIATVESLGAGQVVVVSDPSLFINVMLDRGDNRRFLENVLRGHDRVVVDLSHTEALPPIVRVQRLLRGSPLIQLALGLGLLAGVAVLTRRGLARARRDDELVPETALSEDEVETAVRRRRPDWDDERIRRVTQGVLGRRRQGKRDD